MIGGQLWIFIEQFTFVRIGNVRIERQQAIAAGGAKQIVQQLKHFVVRLLIER
jgi:hypothetical protein